MFTGIIQKLGVVKTLDRQSDLLRIGISASFANSVKIGDSIAINGVCLTAVKMQEDILFFDAISSTLKTTNFGSLKLNDKVNLEQALGVNDRLSGHIVTGHIDTTAVIRNRAQVLNYSLRSGSGQAVFEIALDQGLMFPVICSSKHCASPSIAKESIKA